MNHFLDLIFSGFFHFIGGVIILGMILKFLAFIWNRFWRHWVLRKHGYPPEYCDADGDFMDDFNK
jgi:hypothetical protein